MSLPNTYQEVEYIYSDGQQILNSGFTTSSNYLQIDWKIRYLNDVGSYNYFYAGSPSWLSMERDLAKARWNTASSTALLATPMTQGVDYVYNIKYNNGTQTVNSNSTSYSGSIASKGPIYFFCGGSTLSNAPSAIRCYYLKIYSGSSYTLVRDFVPCYRKLDNKAGMYDLVNDVFYTSTTSVDFIAGPDVKNPNKISKIYVGTNQVRPVGGGGGSYTPTANTIAYFPLTSDVNDYSGNGHTSTNNGVTFTTVNGKSVGYFDGSSYVEVADSADLRGSNGRTTSIWYKYTSGGTTAMDLLTKGKDNATGAWCGCRILVRSGDRGDVQAWLRANSSGPGISKRITASLDGNWHNMVFAFNSSNGMSLYYDGVQQTSTSTSGYSFTYNNTSNVQIGRGQDSSHYTYYYAGYMSEVIIENKTRTATEILNYYNDTKGDYGIS